MLVRSPARLLNSVSSAHRPHSALSAAKPLLLGAAQYRSRSISVCVPLTLLSLSLSLSRGVATATGNAAAAAHCAPNPTSAEPTSSSSAAASGGGGAVPRLLQTAYVIEPTGEHKSTIVWLHGLGDSSAGFADVFEHHLQLPTTRVVLCNAPQRAITVNGGARMQAWYNIRSMDRDSTGKRSSLCAGEDRDGILNSAQLLEQLLDAESARIGSTNIVLGGFSQGGAMSIHTGLRYCKPLGGIVSCSGYVLLRDDYNANPDTTAAAASGSGERRAFVSEANKHTPVLAYHGTDDAMVPMHWAKGGYDQLQKVNGANIDFRSEPGLQHSLSAYELRALMHFFTKTIKA